MAALRPVCHLADMDRVDMQRRLALCTWQDVETYLEGSQHILVPIGSTEQHGPNGLLGTDFICAELVAERVAERIDALVAPTIAVGMALHHLAFPGTISLSPETLIHVIRDYATSLYRHGFRALVFVNGHGGNIATGNAAFSAIRELHSDIRLLWVNWYMQPGVQAIARELYGKREGSHATPSEIALTMAAYPNVVRPIDGPMDTSKCAPRGIPGSVRFREWYPDGRVGSDPSLAKPEHGERLLSAAVEAIAEKAVAL